MVDYNRAYDPTGQITRGKTAHHRLRRTDIFILKYFSSVVSSRQSPQAYCVDLGYGEYPATTIELYQHFSRVNSAINVLGVEIDKQRVELANRFAHKHLMFRQGSFDLPLYANESVRYMRAFNVLRQYDESVVETVYPQLVEQMLPRGILLEGTSNVFGDVWAANVVTQSSRPDQKYRVLATVFSTNFKTGFDLTEFMAVLPKNMVHRMLPGEETFDFFQAWERAQALAAPAKTWGYRHWFRQTGQALAQQGFRVVTHPWWLQRGYLIWLRD